MGQYYKLIILANDKEDNKEVILLVLNPHDYNHGAKLMEHSYMNTDIMNTVEFLICSHSKYYQSRIVWAGDYADNETNEDYNLYYLGKYSNAFDMVYHNVNYNYIVNHTKKEYVDKSKCNNSIHPLPLLISEGNGKGGGDYDGVNLELCGYWSRDVISMEESLPLDYIELIPEFNE